MIKYMRFDIESFLRDSINWESQIKEYEADLSAISELKAIEPSAGHSSNISDTVAMTVAEREKVQQKIDRVLLYKRALSQAYNTLSEPQKEVISVFFYSSGRKDKLVYDYGRKYALNTKAVYRERRLALEQMREVIEEEYEL